MHILLNKDIKHKSSQEILNHIYNLLVTDTMKLSAFFSLYLRTVLIGACVKLKYYLLRVHLYNDDDDDNGYGDSNTITQ